MLVHLSQEVKEKNCLKSTHNNSGMLCKKQLEKGEVEKNKRVFRLLILYFNLVFQMNRFVIIDHQNHAHFIWISVILISMIVYY